MSQAYQVQMTEVLDDGTEVKVYPKNWAEDVSVGSVSSGNLTLPGSDKNEILSVTLSNIKKYLSNLTNIASELREVSQSAAETSAIHIPSTAVTSKLKERLDEVDTTLASHLTAINGKAPINHAANDTTYGGATGSKYGHVILSDTYATSIANGAAANSMAPSQNALYNAYNELNSGKAPNKHAVNASTYGLGTESVYGHVKASSTYTSTSSDTSMVATRAALYNAYKELTDKNSTQDTNINGKAPTSHASTASTYGLGTTSAYGHLKISDNVTTDNSSSGAAANAVAASSYAVYNAYSTLLAAVNTKLASSHADTKATASVYGHVKLSDSYTSSAGAASAGVGASSLAVYNAYSNLSSLITDLQSSVSTLNSKVVNATGSNYGLVELSDNYALDSDVEDTGASTGIGASLWAVNRTYTSLRSAITNNLDDVEVHKSTNATASVYGHVKLSDSLFTNTNAYTAKNGIGASSYAVGALRIELLEHDYNLCSGIYWSVDGVYATPQQVCAPLARTGTIYLLVFIPNNIPLPVKVVTDSNDDGTIVFTDASISAHYKTLFPDLTVCMEADGSNIYIVDGYVGGPVESKWFVYDF